MGVGIMVYMMRDKEILLETIKGLGQQDTEYISLNYKGKLCIQQLRTNT